MGGAKIVTKEDWESEERNVQFDEECFNLNKFWSCIGETSVFGFDSTWSRNNLLFSTGPGNQIRAKETTMATCTFPIIRAASLISISITSEREISGWLKRNAMGNGTLMIAKNPLNSLPMSYGRRVHELKDLVDRKTNLRSGDGTIL